MNAESLKPGDVVFAQTSQVPYQIVRRLGGGGQGEVYEAQHEGERVAVKWIHARLATQDCLENLAAISQRPAPAPSFLCPDELVSASGRPGFGYLMKLVPDDHLPLIDLLADRVDPTFITIVTVAFRLAQCFRRLHASGRVFADLNLGNVFLHPGLGEVLICDNDNIFCPGGAVVDILSPPGFNAPERERHGTPPTRHSDQFALAVILFHLLFRGHPLEGMQTLNCFSPEEQRRCYVDRPVFAYHPKNTANRPHPEYHATVMTHWKLYPKHVKALFVHSFTKGIRHPGTRLTEGTWQRAMLRLRNSVTLCHRCDAQLFVHFDRFGNARRPRCWNCGERARLPLMLRLSNGHSIFLHPQAELHRANVDNDLNDELREPVMRVEHRFGGWCLQNRSTDVWLITSPGSSMAHVRPGYTLPIREGKQIDFRGAHGVIQKPSCTVKGERHDKSDT